MVLSPALELLAFGTKVRIGERTYHCYDRLHRKYDDRFDIWMSSKNAALAFGKRILLVEVVEMLKRFSSPCSGWGNRSVERRVGMHRHARLEGFAESRPARATRRLRRARRLNPKPRYGGHQDSRRPGLRSCVRPGECVGDPARYSQPGIWLRAWPRVRRRLKSRCPPPTTRRSAHRRAVRQCRTTPGGWPIDGTTARRPPGCALMATSVFTKTPPGRSAR